MWNNTEPLCIKLSFTELTASTFLSDMSASLKVTQTISWGLAHMTKEHSYNNENSHTAVREPSVSMTLSCCHWNADWSLSHHLSFKTTSSVKGVGTLIKSGQSTLLSSVLKLNPVSASNSVLTSHSVSDHISATATSSMLRSNSAQHHI